jgi:hypothetical protein
MCNGPDTKNTLDLPLQSDVRVWREKEGWTGPYKLIATEEETCTINMSRGPVKFRSTVVRPYLTEQPCQEELEVPEEPQDEGPQDEGTQDEGTQDEEPQETRRGQGRPKGPRNRRRTENNELCCSEHHLITKHNDQFIAAIKEDDVSMTFITCKEQANIELAIKLRKDGVITTPGSLFKRAQQQEIDGLIARGVFEFVQYDFNKHSGVRIFNSRLVNKVKRKATNSPFKKSRLVVQAYNNEGKELILTQSPTIQQASQRVIIAVAPSLAKLGIKLYLQDITQAYIQLTTILNRLILANLPNEMCH